jgi:hypothetical protein
MRKASRRKEALLTAQKAKSLLAYNPKTGILNWISSGCVAGWVDSAKGYAHVCIAGEDYLAHRVIWLMETGLWPIDQLDHKNGCRSDNRFENLREASDSLNSQNVGWRADNKSGYAGVSWHKSANKWVAQLRMGKRTLYLGVYADPADAHAAYCAAKKQHHPFANIDRIFV